MVVSYSGIAGRRGKNPTKFVIHNDGGSQGATAAFYKGWLEHHTPSLGFAHEYIASDGTYQAEKPENSAWHCGNSVGNRDYYGIEICQSLGNEETFRANEEKAFKRVAQLCKQWGLKPSVAIVPLHRELSSTDCPHRSFALHGKANAAVKQYYVDQVLKYMNGSSSNGSNSSTSTSGSGLAANPKPLTNGKVGDKVKVYDALYVSSEGGGRSTKMRGKTGTIKKVAASGKRYLVESWGWGHANDLQLVSGSSSTSKPSVTGQIATIQTWLNKNYAAGLAVDNSGGSATKKAIVKAVQKEMNKQYNAKLAIDGSFGPACKKAWIPFTQGTSGNLTRLVQAMLYVKGFNPQGFDGSFGAGCKSAVRSFQSSKKLSVDGWVGQATASSLFS